MPCHAGNAIVSGTARYSTVLGRTGREHFQKVPDAAAATSKRDCGHKTLLGKYQYFTYCSMFSNRSGERESLFKSSRLFLRLCVRHTEHGSVRTASDKLPLPDSSTRVAAWRCSHLEVRERRCNNSCLSSGPRPSAARSLSLSLLFSCLFCFDYGAPAPNSNDQSSSLSRQRDFWPTTRARQGRERIVPPFRFLRNDRPD